MVQNKAYSEKCPYTRNTKTLHELSQVEPVNFAVYQSYHNIYKDDEN